MLEIFSGSYRMEFEPVPIEDDELIQAIENDIVQADNNWQLEERPDPDRLEAFWRNVVSES